MSQPVRPLLVAAADRLRAAGIDSAAQDARVLLAFVSGVELVRLPLLSELDDDHVRRFDRLVAERAARVPLQHLTGRAHFRHVSVEVGPGVFVPRPETEVMTGWAIERLSTMITLSHRPLVVELGTGSGAIAKAIANELTRVDLYAVERSESAAAYARRNLADTLVELQVADMATALSGAGRHRRPGDRQPALHPAGRVRLGPARRSVIMIRPRRCSPVRTGWTRSGWSPAPRPGCSARPGWSVWSTPTSRGRRRWRCWSRSGAFRGRTRSPRPDRPAAFRHRRQAFLAGC